MPLGLDVVEPPLMLELQKLGIEVRDGQQTMLAAREVKSQDELILLNMAAAMVDGVYQDIAEALKPGVKESEIVALATARLYEMGSDCVEAINAIAGERCSPHPHNFTDRLIRPGDQAFFDVIQSYMGYRTCYYRTFNVGMATRPQRDAYRRAREWMDRAIDLLKPGVSSDRIARSFPTAKDIGFGSEMDAFGLNFCHGLGLGLHERPLVSRLNSLKEPDRAQSRHGVRRGDLLPGDRRLLRGAHRGRGDPDAGRAEGDIAVSSAGVADCQSAIEPGTTFLRLSHGTVLLLLSAGVAAQTVFTYPSSATISVYSSNDTVSTWTETAAQDYLIPNSQVFITGRGSDGAKYFGLLGTAVSRSQNESAAGGAADVLRLNFSAELTRALQGAIAARQAPAQFVLAESPQAAQLKLLPSAKFTVAEDNSARLSFRLTVRFVDAISNSEVKKDYYYTRGGVKSLTGADSWSADNAEAVRKSSEEALTRLADVLFDDVAGAFASAFDADKQRFATYTVVGYDGKPIRALLLKEYPDHLVIAPLLRGERPIKSVVVILERRAIVLQPLS